MARNKRKLRKDYNNWWAVAGDIYGGKAGQRAYAALKAANPGVTRFYRGMTLNVPNIDVSRIRLTDEQVAKERNEWDYTNNRPTDAYFQARDGSAPTMSPDGTATSGPIYEGQQYPNLIRPGLIELENGTRIRAPYPWESATPQPLGGPVGSMGGLQPSQSILMNQFYGTAPDIRQGLPDTTRGARQQADQLRGQARGQQYADYYARQQTSQPITNAPTQQQSDIAAEARRFAGGRGYVPGNVPQYPGGGFMDWWRSVAPPQADRIPAGLTGSTEQATGTPPTYPGYSFLDFMRDWMSGTTQETGTPEGLSRIGLPDIGGEQGIGNVAFPELGTNATGLPAPGIRRTPTAGVTAPGTTPEEKLVTQDPFGGRDHNWLAPWMAQNLPSAIGGGEPSPAELEQIPEELLETMFVLGLVEPTPFSTGYAATESFSRGIGYVPPYYSGRRSSSARRSRGSYSYPTRSGGVARSYDRYTNLVKWNI